jgi:hypothetical protein
MTSTITDGKPAKRIRVHFVLSVAWFPLAGRGGFAPGVLLRWPALFTVGQVAATAARQQLGSVRYLAKDALLSAEHAPGDGRAAHAQRPANLGIGAALVAQVGDEQLDRLELKEDLDKKLAVDHSGRNCIEHLFYSSEKKEEGGADAGEKQRCVVFTMGLLSPENGIRDTQISIAQNLDFVTAFW